MSHPIHWLYQQFMGTIPGGQAACYLCGSACPPELTVAKGIADTFNSHYIAKVPSSPWLCAACFWYFDSKAGHPDFRKMSLIVAEKVWHNWRREDMKMEIDLWVSHGLEADAYLVASLSKKKHILLQAPMNVAGTKMLSVQVEEQVAYIHPWHWKTMNASFMALLNLGHNKGEILSGNLYGNTLRKHGQIKEVMGHSQMLEPYRNSAALELLSYVTIVDKGEESGTDATGTGDGGRPTSGHAPESCMEPDRRVIQESVSHGNLAASRERSSRIGSDDEHTDKVSQQSLW